MYQYSCIYNIIVLRSEYFHSKGRPVWYLEMPNLFPLFIVEGADTMATVLNTFLFANIIGKYSG